MSHELYRLTSRIYNTPQMILAEQFEVILNYLNSRNNSSFEKYSSVNEVVTDSVEMYRDGLGVIKIDGTLSYRPIVTMCGDVGTSYQSLVAQVEDMASAGVTTIVMEVSSGGGAADHCFESAQEVRSICDENNIRLIGYADEYACSAAYAWLSVSDVVIANPSATLGSIGCVVALLDTSKAMDQAGLKRIFITSGESKVPFADDGSFKKEFLEEIQESVDRLNDEFAAHVSTHTGLDVSTIKGFEARVFNAEVAVEKGLANAVMTNKQFANYVAQVHKGNY